MAITSQQGVALRNREPWCRAERLYQLKCMFIEGGSYTVAELAEMFAVVDTTIQRDLRLLSTKMCVPLVCEERWRIMRK